MDYFMEQLTDMLMDLSIVIGTIVLIYVIVVAILLIIHKLTK